MPGLMIPMRRIKRMQCQCVARLAVYFLVPCSAQISMHPIDRRVIDGRQWISHLAQLGERRG
jgi:hypothetical protein